MRGGLGEWIAHGRYPQKPAQQAVAQSRIARVVPVLLASPVQLVGVRHCLRWGARLLRYAVSAVGTRHKRLGAFAIARAVRAAGLVAARRVAGGL